MNEPTPSFHPDRPRPARARQRIAVVHADAIGLSTALLLAQRHDVVLQDQRASRVEQINTRRLPTDEPGLNERLAHPGNGLLATTDLELAVDRADCVFVTTPTHFDRAFGSVDTTALDATLHEVRLINPHATLVLASNPPVGYSQHRASQTGDTSPPIVLPTPLRDGHVFQDRWHPQRLVVGECSRRAVHLALLLRDCLLRPGVPYVLTHATEAEAIYLFEQKRELLGGALTRAEVVRYAGRHGLDLNQLLEGLGIDLLPAPAHGHTPEHTPEHTPDRLPWAQTVPYRPDHPSIPAHPG